MLEITYNFSHFAIAAVVTLAASAVQGTLGFGFGLLSVGVLRLVHPDLAPVPQMVVSLVLVVLLARRERSAIQWHEVLWVSQGRLLGAALGAVLLGFASARLLDGVLGTLMLAAVAVMLLGAQVPFTPKSLRVAGVVSSFAGVVSAVGGPPLAVVYASVTGPRLRATLSSHFFVGMVLSLVARWFADALPGAQVGLGIALLPFAVVGYRLSSWLKDHLQPHQLRTGILGLVVLSAGSLLVRALTG